MSQGKMVRVGGLWKKQGKDGTTYLAGSFGTARLMVFTNDRKKAPNEPDYVLMVGEKDEEGKGRDEGAKPAVTGSMPF